MRAQTQEEDEGDDEDAGRDQAAKQGKHAAKGKGAKAASKPSKQTKGASKPSKKRKVGGARKCMWWYQHQMGLRRVESSSFLAGKPVRMNKGECMGWVEGRVLHAKVEVITLIKAPGHSALCLSLLFRLVLSASCPVPVMGKVESRCTLALRLSAFCASVLNRANIDP